MIKTVYTNEEVVYDGTFNSALDTLKNNESIKEATRGFNVQSVKITGDPIVRTITIELIKNHLSKEEVNEVMMELLKQAQELSTKLLKKLAGKSESEEDKKEEKHD